ncbi:Uncharacterized protein TCM_037974 [Theobroma cacao]|uniref:Uncharacterized protein n=1 Tax=Theobroma cacao TaxID=3641 RepID=A0A061GNE6_THECC|nr:Uncharacterized protein TCM_037974 [Theobroma cacao]
MELELELKLMHHACGFSETNRIVKGTKLSEPGTPHRNNETEPPRARDGKERKTTHMRDLSLPANCNVPFPSLFAVENLGDERDTVMFAIHWWCSFQLASIFKLVQLSNVDVYVEL